MQPMTKSRFPAVALVGILSVGASLAARAAEPAVLREFGFKTDNVPAYVQELETLQALYKKHGLDVRIDAFRGTYAGASAGDVAVQILVANLATLAKLEELTRTQPDLVAETKKIGGMGKLTLKALHQKLTPLEGNGVTSSAALPMRAAAPAVMRIIVVQTADVPAYVHELETLKALYKQHGLDVRMEEYQNYAGVLVDEAFVEMLVANLAELAKMDETTRTQPDLVAQVKKIGGMQKVVYEGIYEKLTP